MASKAILVMSSVIANMCFSAYFGSFSNFLIRLVGSKEVSREHVVSKMSNIRNILNIKYLKNIHDQKTLLVDEKTIVNKKSWEIQKEAYRQ